jgi:hypothetical protein
LKLTAERAPGESVEHDVKWIGVSSRLIGARSEQKCQVLNLDNKTPSPPIRIGGASAPFLTGFPSGPAIEARCHAPISLSLSEAGPLFSAECVCETPRTVISRAKDCKV